MGEESEAPYSSMQVTRATNLGAFLGWLFYSAWMLTGAYDVQQAIMWLPIMAIIGLPIAFLVTWLVGRPILKRIMRRQVGWLLAASGGGLISAIIAVISIVIGQLNGLRAYNDPNFDFNIGAGANLSESDGILTLYGWKLLAQDTMIFILMGSAIGVIIRTVIGPGDILSDRFK
jgi:hypothetical protein